MFNRLSNAPNRSIVYDLYSYICDIKSGIGLARAYVKTLGRNVHRVAAAADVPKHVNIPGFCCWELNVQQERLKPAETTLRFDSGLEGSESEALTCFFKTGGQHQATQLVNDDPEAWTLRGGLSGEFQVGWVFSVWRLVHGTGGGR